MTSQDPEKSPYDSEEWEKFVRHVRADALQKIASSAFVMSIVPKKDAVDIKFAVELGLSIMMDKPIIALVMPGAEVPTKLRLVVDRVIEADIDTEEGRAQFSEALREMGVIDR